MRRIWLLLVPALALGCSRADEAAAPEEVRTVRVMTVGARPAARSVDYSGEVRARTETRLGFRVGGKILARLVDPGAVVKTGQALARLDDTDLALAARSAASQVAAIEADRALAAADVKRFRDLLNRKFISAAEYERRATLLATTESRLEAARAQHRQAVNQAGYATLVADADGIVTGVEAEPGQVVSAGQTVVRLARHGEREIAFVVPEAQRELVETAAGFSVTLSARPGRSWQARLRELSPAADPVTRTYAARATLVDSADDVELGMSARIAVRERAAPAAIEVPIAALYARGDRAQVFLVEGGNVVRLQPVTTGGISGERVVIESGLKPGDVVVTAGAQLLRTGQRVRPLAR